MAAKTQKKKAAASGLDENAASSNAPQKWSDYTVEFHFPTPTELPPPLVQMIDVDFKYPSRWVCLTRQGVLAMPMHLACNAACIEL